MGTTSSVLVTFFGQKPNIFGDETCSRHRFEAKNALFWRRASFSSPFLVENLSILATRPVLVTVLRRKMLVFGDEARSRHRFEAKNARFWRRGSFSSPFLVENLSILATRLVLVTVFGRKPLNFGDEARSRHRFEAKNARFWRRGQFSSPFLVENLIFLATKPNLVVIFGRKPLNFGDEACSRHRFEVKNALFWRRGPFSSPFLVENLSILATKPNLVIILR
ncbi:hypothetical protein [Caldibacillus thermoamylovorans]|uniref:hypothetical protein n=1 Tax=Caldibacillus thermoamylovorans TaxID=35841 RepID=UPI0020420DD9|nr:hypothetical protein [Caldibacillus thermoamylovorans]MCM3056136.1 hypothetical protein [Caldibacillus thermoamylovorans]